MTSHLADPPAILRHSSEDRRFVCAAALAAPCDHTEQEVGTVLLTEERRSRVALQRNKVTDIMFLRSQDCVCGVYHAGCGTGRMCTHVGVTDNASSPLVLAARPVYQCELSMMQSVGTDVRCQRTQTSL